MDIYSTDLKFSFGGIEVFVLYLPFCIAVQRVGKVSAEFLYVKMGGAIPISSSGVNAMEIGP